jgi:hypothetical protein
LLGERGADDNEWKVVMVVGKQTVILMQEVRTYGKVVCNACSLESG